MKKILAIAALSAIFGIFGVNASAMTETEPADALSKSGTVESAVYAAKVKSAGGTEKGFASLAEALSAAQNGETVELVWNEGDAPIVMKGEVFGKTVTITGTAVVDWSKGFLFVGRGGEGNGTVIFDDAKLTSASNQASTGIHVSGREKNTNNKYDGTLVIKNSTIELDYLINKGTMTLDNSTLTVKNGFSIGGRPANETVTGEDATATLNIVNGSKVVVNNHNGMGLGYEAIGVMNVKGDSTFECTQDFLITEKGTLNVDGGNVIIAGTLTNLGVDTTFKDATVKINKLDNDAALFIEGTNTIQIEDMSGSSFAIRIKDGAVLNDSYMPGTGNETARLLGSATFNGGFKCAYLQGSSAGVGGTVTIEEDTVIEASYGVEFSKNYTINGGTIKIAGGNASGDVWGCVFQNAAFDINTNIVVDGNGNTAPIHFTNATANVTSSITQSRTGGEPIYINDGSVVTFGDDAVVTTDCAVFVYEKLKSSGKVDGTITKAADAAVIEISGGIYTQDVSAYLAEGCELKNKDDKYIVLPTGNSSLPTATVTELKDTDLTFAMNFHADDVTEEQLAYYGDWYADFVLTVNKDVTFNANGGADGYLSGQYDEYGENWVNVPFTDVTLEEGNSLKIMEYAAELLGEPGLKYTYGEVYGVVKDFDCGVYLTKEFIFQNPDFEVTLELRMYNPADASESYAIGDTYKFKAVSEGAENIFGKSFFIKNMNKEDDGSYRLGVFAGIDSLKYREVGFEIEAKAETASKPAKMTISTDTVYSSVTAGDETVTAEALGVFRIFGKVGKFPTKYDNVPIYATPYAIKLDGEKIVGRTNKIRDIYN